MTFRPFLILALALSGCQASAAGSITPSTAPSTSASPGASAAPSAAPGMKMATATSLKIDGVEKTLLKTYEADPGSRGVTYTVGNMDANVRDAYTFVVGVNPAGTTAGLQNMYWYADQGNAIVQQTYQWDGTPEVNTYAAGTWTFKGKVKRYVTGSVGPATMMIEGSISGLTP